MRVLAAAFVLLMTAAAQPTPEAVSPEIGVYLGWVGTYPGNRLEAGARLAKSSGFQTIRLPLVASADVDFGIRRVCDAHLTLAQTASLPAYAAVLHDPAFRTIFLTTWGDSHSYNPCQPRDPRSDQHPDKLYLQKKYYSAENRDGMRAEYAELSYHLYKTYRSSGKTFGISNWEGDNELYCDAALYFATKPSFREDCEEKRETSDVLDAYRQYLTLRHEGIESGRRRGRREGFTGVNVIDVIEFSALRFLKQNHLQSVLDDVIPSVPAPGYFSYSAWESLGEPLLQDLEHLQDRFHDRLIAGEFGFDRGLDPSAAAHAASSVTAIEKARVSYGIYWQIFDQPPVEGLGDKGLYGLYDEKGRLTTTGIRFLEIARRPKSLLKKGTDRSVHAGRSQADQRLRIGDRVVSPLFQQAPK